MILPICVFGHPVLRKNADPIDPETYPNLNQLIEDMHETMNRADGVGLAAPQVGLPIRLFTIGLDVMANEAPEYKGYRHAFINPEIVEAGPDTESMSEGCLSIPGINEDVRRPTRILARYTDENLQPVERWMEGFEARVFQHEFDHLDGRMFVDRLSPFRKQLIKSKLLAMAKGKYSAHYKCKANR